MTERTINEQGLRVTGQLYQDILEAGTVFLYLEKLATSEEQKRHWRQAAERWRYRQKRIKAAFNTETLGDEDEQQGVTGTATAPGDRASGRDAGATVPR